MVFSQLFNDCKVIPLTIDGSGNSTSVDTLDAMSIAFLVKAKTPGALAFKVQESADPATGFADLIIGYFDDGVSDVIKNGTAVLSVTGTTTATGTLMALSVNRQGRETSVPNVTSLPASKRYLRIVITTGASNVEYGVAFATNNLLTPVAQPAFASQEVQGSN